MARKIFQQLAQTVTDSGQRNPDDEQPVRPRRHAAPAIGSLRESLREITASSIQDIDPNLIDVAGPKDRIDFEADGIDKLAESIRKHGQQVPILVRPGQSPNRFTVVYGRRRLAAARLLGTPIKAVVRSLDDEAAILAQGQENAMRLNPSFIETALFVRDMHHIGIDIKDIQEAIGVDGPAISRFRAVLNHIPDEVIHAIGAAHGSGRRPWLALAYLVRDHGIDLKSCLPVLMNKPELDSDQRLNAVLSAARRLAHPQKAPERDKTKTIKLRDTSGQEIGLMQRSAAGLSVTFQTDQNPGFCDWFEANAEAVTQKIHALWLEASSATDAAGSKATTRRKRTP